MTCYKDSIEVLMKLIMLHGKCNPLQNRQSICVNKFDGISINIWLYFMTDG